MRPRLLVVCGYEPNPITLRKVEALLGDGIWDIHLAYWRRDRLRDRTPFTWPGDDRAVHPIDMVAERQLPHGTRDPLGGLRGFAALVGFHRKLRQVVRHVDPHLIHASNSNMLLATWPLCIGHPHRALVYDLLDTDDAMRRWPVVQIERRLHRRVDQITVPSPAFVTDFLRRLSLIDPTVDPTLIFNAPWRDTFAHLPSRDGLPVVVGYIGSLRCLPAIEWLIASTARVRATGIDIALLFAGTGMARALVEQAAAEHTWITYAGPYDYQHDIRQLYAQVDVVYAVYEDTWDKRTHLACRLSDAVASTRAIIVSSGTLMGALVARDHLGYVVDPQVPHTLDAALADAVARRADWRRADRIPDAVRRAHEFESYVTPLREVYRSALARRAPALVHD